MGNTGEMSTGISKGLRGRLGAEIWLYTQRKRGLPPQNNTVKRKASLFNDYQVKSERSFTEKVSKLRPSERGGGGGGGET